MKKKDKYLNTIVRVVFGSRLYGTNTPESDIDYKGVFLPNIGEVFLNKIPKSINTNTKKSSVESKNTKDDVDCEIYSLHYFIQLACEGQTVALDMLHAPDNMILETSDIWEEIVKNRSRFYTKNLKAFIGYARKQAAKYGIKGSRLNAAKKMMDLLASTSEEKRVADIWDKLPLGEHIHIIEPNPHNIEQVQVCGRIIQATSRVKYALEIVKTFYDNYGARAEKAAKNTGIDWKAVSHAIRAAYQLKEILEDGTITFPLKEAEYVKKVKAGELDYTTDVAPKLESLMEKVEELSAKSGLPEKVDRKFWDKFIIGIIEDML